MLVLVDKGTINGKNTLSLVRLLKRKSVQVTDSSEIDGFANEAIATNLGTAQL